MHRVGKSNWLISLVLGALNGAIYSGVQFWVVPRYYDWIVASDQAKNLGSSPVQMTNNTNQRMVAIWLVVLFAVTSWLAHRYLARLTKYPLLFWQIVGLGAVVGWNVIFLVLLWAEKELTGQALSYERITSSSDPLSGPISMGLVILTNLLYGTVLQLVLREKVAIDTQGQQA